MNKNHLISGAVRALLYTLIIAPILVGCDANPMTSEDEALDALRSLDLVEKTYMTALGPNENGEIDYLLEVVLRDVESIDYPDAVNILGLVDGMPSTLISDDGTGFAAVAHDRVYSGIVPESCLPAGIPDERAGKGFKITISCDWTFISPGSVAKVMEHVPRRPIDRSSGD